MLFQISDNSQVEINVGSSVKFIDGPLPQFAGQYVEVVQTDSEYIFFINTDGAVTAITPKIVLEVI